MMFDPNHQPPSEADSENEQRSTFYKAAGNLSEFGLYFSGGLALALLSRLIPGMLIAYAMLLGLTAGYIALALGRDRRESAVIGLAIAASVVAGFWDAIASLIAIANPILLISIPTVFVCLATLWRVRK
ncbi:hypothetical protein [Funiculus sociatus]|uniref:hypothetical protein n=1 Tax=Funiculus sociatus TaxID=450527 RepID=UPI00329781F5